MKWVAIIATLAAATPPYTPWYFEAALVAACARLDEQQEEVMAKREPMLAERDSVHNWPGKLTFPLYATPKLDGIRCVIENGKAVSRTFKDIPNKHIRSLLSSPTFSGFDGELTVGPVSAENVFNVTTSGVMSQDGKPDFTYHVFDDFSDPTLAYNERQVKLRERLLAICEAALDSDTDIPKIMLVDNVRLETWEGLEAYEDSMLGFGFEGVITRHPDGRYKFGRSTKREQGMLKLKRFTDGEAEVTGFSELMVNNNPDLKDNFGRTKRSKAQGGLVPGGTLGKIQCRDLETKIEFQIGMFKGLSLADKQEIWDNQDKYRGKFCKYQHLAHGAIDKPRHSKFLGWRDPIDM